jgi:hypothetical protein
MSLNHTNQFIDNATKALSLLDVSIGVWTGVAKLKKAAQVAAKQAGASSKVARVYVDLLGKQQRKLKVVTAAHAAIRTYLYENTLPFAADTGGQKRGPRLLPVVRVPEVFAKLAELRAVAGEALESFLKEYDRYVEISMAQDMGTWNREITSANKLPSVDDVRRKFYCSISAPRPIPNNAAGVADMALPIGMASDFISEHYGAIDDQLKQAKDAAVKQAKDQMALLEEQLGAASTTVNKAGVVVPTKRLHESLITNSKRVASMLRDMVEGYDSDPRLLGLADKIDNEIAHVKSVDVWKTSPSARDDALKAASDIKTSLANYKAAPVTPKAAPKPTPKPPPTPTPTTPAPTPRKRRSSGIVGRKSQRNNATGATAS